MALTRYYMSEDGMCEGSKPGDISYPTLEGDYVRADDAEAAIKEAFIAGWNAHLDQEQHTSTPRTVEEAWLESDARP